MRGGNGREMGNPRRDGGGRGGRASVEGEKRGVKRERGACEKMDIYRRQARELVRRGPVRKREAETACSVADGVGGGWSGPGGGGYSFCCLPWSFGG